MLAYKSLHGSAASDHLDLMRGGAAIGSCALAYAFVIARLTEYRTGAVRARVIAAIDRKAENRSEAR